MRHSIRHREHDYRSSGAYFVTIVTQNKKHYFGEIQKDVHKLNPAGQMVSHEWTQLPDRFESIRLGEFIVMPNHFHGIVILGMVEIHDEWIQLDTSSNPLLGNVIGAFKSITTREYMAGVKTSQWPQFENRLWQRNFYERVIRNDHEFEMISEYIRMNPSSWEKDIENPQKTGTDEFDLWLYS